MAVFDVTTAALRLGVDETEVCRMITDGRLTSLRERGGRLCVLLDEGTEPADLELSGQAVAPKRVPKTDAETIAKLQATVAHLEAVCASLRDEVQRSQVRLSAAQREAAPTKQSAA